jgi:prepilin-type N-terminal cleavage/methylation domain-containing protein
MSNQNSNPQAHRRALTLVELLVVIVILGLVTAATIPLMQPATAQRRMREASRMVATVLANAQARALATGRPVGVMFQRLSNQQATPTFKTPHHSIEMFLCEVPSPFSGETSSSVCRIKTTNPPGSTRIATLHDDTLATPIPPMLPPRRLREGDRIRLNYRGYLYTIKANPNDPDQNYRSTVDPEGFISGRAFLIMPQNGALAPLTPQPIPFQIYHQPRKTADPPAQMPVGSVVDLEYAGYSSGWLGALENPTSPPAQRKLSFHHPVIVMFGPSGNLESVSWGWKPVNAGEGEPGTIEPSRAVTSPWYLLIGQPPGDDAITQGRLNHINFDHAWIAISPQSGLVTTSEVASEFNEPTEPEDADVSKELDASRAFARSAQNMAGR